MSQQMNPMQVYVPQNDAIQRALQQAYAAQAAAQKAREGGFSRLRVEFPGPDGTPKSFKSAPVGFRSTKYLFCLPPFVGEYIEPFVEEVTHFWKSPRAPQGSSVLCMGPERCPICLGRKALFRLGTQEATTVANKWGKRGTKYLSQWVDLSLPPQNHLNQQGQVIPASWQAPGGVRTAMLEKMAIKGAAMLLNPQHGRPLAVTKKKTGTEEINVEYAVDDVEGSSLNQWYWSVYNNLNDLRTWIEEPNTYEEYQRALAEMQFLQLPSGQVVNDGGVYQALVYVWQLDQQRAAKKQQAQQQAAMQLGQQAGVWQQPQLPQAQQQQQWQPQAQPQQQQWQQPQQQGQQLQMRQLPNGQWVYG